MPRERSSQPRSTSPSKAPPPEAPVERKEVEALPDEERTKLSLAAKLSLIIGEVGSVPKQGYNDYHKYHYVRETDLVAAIGPLFARYRIVILPSVADITRNGEVTRVTLDMVIINGDNTDDRFELKWVGEGSDRADKGVYKAYTGAIKYFLMKLLQVATGDDPEGFTRVDAEANNLQSRPVEITDSTAKPVQKGGRPNDGTIAQISRISTLSQALALGPYGLVEVINRELNEQILLPDDAKVANRHLADFLSKASAADLGLVAWALEEQLRQASAAAPEESPAVEGAVAEKASDEYAGGY